MPFNCLAARVVARLIEAEVCESNPHYLDDLRIARLTVAYAASGEAVLCAPHVLASYRVLGLHPEKVWPAILARRLAVGGPMFEVAQKKPSQSVKLWCDKTNGARAINSRADEVGSPRTVTSVLMAAPSIAALYPKSDASSSAKKRHFTFEQVLSIVRYSGAPHSIRALTASAIEARGPWPNQDGPVSAFLCVSWIGMMVEGGCCRRTAQRRARRAVQLGFWRKTREANKWTSCPKCNAPREVGKCASCGYKGDAKNLDEFCRANGYEFDIEKFLSAPRCREIHSVNWRTYFEYKEAAKRGEHPNVTEMPARKPAQPAPPAPKDPAPAKKTAEQPKSALPKLSRRETAKFVADLVQTMRGHTRHVEIGGYGFNLEESDPRYRPKLPLEAALKEVCERWRRDIDSAREAIKFWGYKIDPDPTP